MSVLPAKLFRGPRKDSFAEARPLAHVGGGLQLEEQAELGTASFLPYPSTAEELPRGMRRNRGGGEAERQSRDQEEAEGRRDGARLLIQALGESARGSRSGPQWGRADARSDSKTRGRGGGCGATARPLA